MADQIGLIAILNTTDFNRGMRAYLEGMAEMKTVTEDSAEALDAYEAETEATGDSSEEAAPKVEKAGDAIAETGEKAGEAKESVLEFGKSLLDAAKSGIAGLYEKISDGIRELNRELFDNIKASEQLHNKLRTLIADELLSSGAVNTMSTAMNLAKIRAGQLSDWIEHLAILSPFAREDVSAVYDHATALGFNSRQAQFLTQRLTDWAAATEHTAGEIDSVTDGLYELTQSTVLTQDALDNLNKAGINTDYILSEMGVAVEDVGRGVVKSEAFMDQFVKTMGDDFSGAAARSTRTLTGVIDKMKEITKLGWREFWEGSGNAITPALNQVADSLMAAIPYAQLFGELLGNGVKFLLDNREALLKWGAALGIGVAAMLLFANASAIAAAATTAFGVVVAVVTSPITLLGAAIAGLAAIVIFNFDSIRKATGNFFGAFNGDLGQFGHDLIISFANGMAQALSAVLDVLMAIGRMFSEWLSPGSPPKLLPEIDMWGKSTADEWLKGWTQADFSLLNDISGPIETWARSLTGIGGDQLTIVTNIIAMNRQLGEAITKFEQVGNIGEEEIQKIRESIGGPMEFPAITEYLRTMFDLEVANKKVAAAQEELNAVTKKYDAALAPIDDELAAIEKRRNAFSQDQRTAELEKILENRRAPAAAKELARMEMREIQLKRQKEGILDQKKVEEDAAQKKLEAAQLEQKMLQERAELMKADIERSTKMNQLIGERNQLLAQMEDLGFGGGGGFGGPGGPGGFEFKVPELDISGATGPLDELKKKFDAFMDEIKAPFADLGQKWEEVKAAWQPGIDEAWNLVSGLYTDLTTGTDTTWSKVVQNTKDWWKDLISGNNTTWNTIKGTVENWWRDLTTGNNTTWNTLYNTTRGWWNDLIAGNNTTWNTIVTTAQTLWTMSLDGYKATWALLSTAAQTGWTNLQTASSTAWTTLVTDATAILTGFKDDIYEIGAQLVDAVEGAIYDKAHSVIDALVKMAEDAIQAVKDVFKVQSPSRVFRDIGVNLMQGAILGISEMAGAVKSSMAYALEPPNYGRSRHPGPQGGPAVMGHSRFLGPPTGGPAVIGNSRYLGPPAAAGQGRTVAVSIGDVSITNGMSLAQFESRVISTVKKALNE